MAGAYPQGVKIYIDGVDVTNWIVGSDMFDPSDNNNSFENIDISSYIRQPGVHNIEITCTAGVGRVESRVELG